jgi:hypothetical protein
MLGFGRWLVLVPGDRNITCERGSVSHGGRRALGAVGRLSAQRLFVSRGKEKTEPVAVTSETRRRVYLQGRVCNAEAYFHQEFEQKGTKATKRT